MKRQFNRVTTVAMLGLWAVSVPAIQYTFPAAANVVDITKPPYSADKTGSTDVSAILTRAANDLIASSGWGPATLYFPDGVYLVRNTFAWRLNDGGNGTGPHVVGQSRTGTIIKLAKGTWPLGTEGKAVIQTGAGVEQNFNKSITNLTVLVDSNNAGAIGIIYVSDNNGLLSDVNVISADGRGQYGVQSASSFPGSTVGGNGPFIIRRTYVKGFQVGIRTCASQSAMVSQIRLEGQTQYGLWASCGNLTIDSLWTNDTCQAVYSQAPIMLTNAVLQGGSSGNYAIYNISNSSFFRDIKTTGYKQAIFSSGTVRPPYNVTSVQEYIPRLPVSLFGTPHSSMNLPAKYPPEVAWETDFNKWAFIENYKINGRTDVQAFQAAIDDPTKTTICLTRGRTYQIDAPVHVRGTIRRIYSTGGTLHKVNTNGTIIIDDGSAPTVIMQKIAIDNVDGTPGPDINIYKRTSRTLILESLNMIDWHIEGGGETYITDITSGKCYVDHPSAQVFLWQWEGTCCMDSTLTVRNGIVRSVGYYDEGEGSMIYCLGGITEMLGFWEYSTMCEYTGKYLIGIRNNAHVSAAGVWQQNFCPTWSGYDWLVSEIRNGVSKKLCGSPDSTDASRVVNPGGSNIVLFTAFDSVQVRQALLTGVGPNVSASVGRDPTTIVSVVRRGAGIDVGFSTSAATPVTVIAYDLAGRARAVVRERVAQAGLHRTHVSVTPGVTCIEVRTAEGRAVVRSVAGVTR